MEFHFPSKVLTAEDFEPVQVLALKEYYKNNFLQMLDKVSNLF